MNQIFVRGQRVCSWVQLLWESLAQSLQNRHHTDTEVLDVMVSNFSNFIVFYLRHRLAKVMFHEVLSNSYLIILIYYYYWYYWILWLYQSCLLGTVFESLFSNSKKHLQQRQTQCSSKHPRRGTPNKQILLDFKIYYFCFFCAFCVARQLAMLLQIYSTVVVYFRYFQ